MCIWVSFKFYFLQSWQYLLIHSLRIILFQISVSYDLDFEFFFISDDPDKKMFYMLWKTDDQPEEMRRIQVTT